MDRAACSRPIPIRTLPGCYALLQRRLPYETTADLALHIENGSLRALAIFASRATVERDEPAVAAAGADRAGLFRHAHRNGAVPERHNRAAGAAGHPRYWACGAVAG